MQRTLKWESDKAMVSDMWAMGEHSVTFLLIIAKFNLENTALDTEWEMKADSPSQRHSTERWLGVNYEST